MGPLVSSPLSSPFLSSPLLSPLSSPFPSSPLLSSRLVSSLLFQLKLMGTLGTFVSFGFTFRMAVHGSRGPPFSRWDVAGTRRDALVVPTKGRGQGVREVTPVLNECPPRASSAS